MLSRAVLYLPKCVFHAREDPVLRMLLVKFTKPFQPLQTV